MIGLSQLEIVILEGLKVAGERGHAVSRPDVTQLSRLVNEGYVKIKSGTTKAALFVISERGLNALTEITGDKPSDQSIGAEAND